MSLATERDAKMGLCLAKDQSMNGIRVSGKNIPDHIVCSVIGYS